MEIHLVLVLVTLTTVTSQRFDTLETTMRADLDTATGLLIRNAQELRARTELFVMGHLKQNLFRKLRPYLESELDSDLPAVRRLPRQNEEEDEDEEETTASSNSTRAADIIPQVANLVKAIFGGNSINVTSYAQAATKYLPPSIGNQVLGVVKLLVHNPSARWTTSTTTATPAVKAPRVTALPPSIVLIRVNSSGSGSTNRNDIRRATVTVPTPVVVPSRDIQTSPKPTVILVLPPKSPPPPPRRTTGKPKEEEEEEEDEDNFRQLRLPDLSPGFNAITSLIGLGGRRRPSGTNATTESASGFEEETTGSGGGSTGGLDLRELASGVRLGLGDLIKVMPDLFKGAREAVGLLTGLQSLLGSFGG